MDGLILLREQGLDLFVGLVHGTGAAGFLLGLAGLAEGGLGEAGVALGRGRNAHAVLMT